MSIRHADRIMVGSKAVSGIKESRPIGPVPTTESQSRPLTKLPADQQPEAWAKAVEAADGKVSLAIELNQIIEPVPI